MKLARIQVSFYRSIGDQPAIIDLPGPRVVWVRLGNTRRQELLRWFERMLPSILAALDRGESLVEVS